MESLLVSGSGVPYGVTEMQFMYNVSVKDKCGDILQ